MGDLCAQRPRLLHNRNHGYPVSSAGSVRSGQLAVIWSYVLGGCWLCGPSMAWNAAIGVEAEGGFVGVDLQVLAGDAWVGSLEPALEVGG